MNFWETWRRRTEKKYHVVYKHGPSTVALIFALFALAAWGLFAMFATYPVFAYAYYRMHPATSTILAQSLRDTGEAAAGHEPLGGQGGTASLPPLDVSLPDGHYVSIPSIGVDTVIREAPYSDYESALKLGVWRVPDFASPGDSSGKPIILAAHRFGYLDWTNDFRLKNSFYNLPNVKPGAKIQITWDQRSYTYQVEKVVEGTEIDDYSANLILYTCKFLVSPVRYFVYAKLVL